MSETGHHGGHSAGGALAESDIPEQGEEVLGEATAAFLVAFFAWYKVFGLAEEIPVQATNPRAKGHADH